VMAELAKSPAERVCRLCSRPDAQPTFVHERSPAAALPARSATRWLRWPRVVEALNAASLFLESERVSIAAHHELQALRAPVRKVAGRPRAGRNPRCARSRVRGADDWSRLSSQSAPWFAMIHGLAAEPGEPPPITEVPCRNQISAAPVPELYQRRSLLPSLLKSPVSAIVQPGADPGEPPPVTDAPFRNQINACAVLLWNQTMSLLPSPLKSPVPTTLQGLPTVPIDPPPLTDVPFAASSQITVLPVIVLYQRMSVLPSPLKSPVPTTVQ